MNIGELAARAKVADEDFGGGRVVVLDERDDEYEIEDGFQMNVEGDKILLRVRKVPRRAPDKPSLDGDERLTDERIEGLAGDDPYNSTRARKTMRAMAKEILEARRGTDASPPLDEDWFERVVGMAESEADTAFLVALEHSPSTSAAGVVHFAVRHAAGVVHFAVRQALRAIVDQGFVKVVPREQAPDFFLNASFGAMQEALDARGAAG